MPAYHLQAVDLPEESFRLFLASKQEMGVDIIRAYFSGGIPEEFVFRAYPDGPGFKR